MINSLYHKLIIVNRNFLRLINIFEDDELRFDTIS